MADVDRHRFRVGGQPEAEPRPAAIRRSLQLRAFDLYKSAGVAAAYRRTFELLRARAAQALIPPDHAVIPLLALGPGVGMSSVRDRSRVTQGEAPVDSRKACAIGRGDHPAVRRAV